MQTFSSVEAEVVARWNLKQMSTDTQRVTLQSPKISNDNDKQYNNGKVNDVFMKFVVTSVLQIS